MILNGYCDVCHEKVTMGGCKCSREWFDLPSVPKSITVPDYLTTAMGTIRRLQSQLAEAEEKGAREMAKVVLDRAHRADNGWTQLNDGEPIDNLMQLWKESKTK